MTTRTKARIYLSIAATILTAALAVPAAQSSCPDYAPVCFEGTFQGQDAHDTLAAGATSVVIRTTATGVGTRLGRFTLDRDVTGNLLDFSAAGSAHWVAANGDLIYTTVSGSAVLSDLPGGYLKVTETHTITGGTGRFAGAQGDFEVELFHKLEVSGVAGGVETHDVFGSFRGSLNFTGVAALSANH